MTHGQPVLSQIPIKEYVNALVSRLTKEHGDIADLKKLWSDDPIGVYRITGPGLQPQSVIILRVFLDEGQEHKVEILGLTGVAKDHFRKQLQNSMLRIFPYRYIKDKNYLAANFNIALRPHATWHNLSRRIRDWGKAYQFLVNK